MWVSESLMTVSTASIPVLHSTEVVPCTHKSCYPSAKGLWIPYTSTKEARQGNTTRPLQSSISFRKPLQFLGRAIARIPRLTAIAAKSTREPPYMPTPLLPLPLVGGLLRSRRSCKKKHLRKISTEIMLKLTSRELRHNNMPKTKGCTDLKMKRQIDPW